MSFISSKMRMAVAGSGVGDIITSLEFSDVIAEGSNANVTTHSLSAYPASTQNGDLAIYMLFLDGSQTLTATELPTGFTFIGGNDPASEYPDMLVGYRIIDGTETTPITSNESFSEGYTVSIITFRPDAPIQGVLTSDYTTENGPNALNITFGDTTVSGFAINLVGLAGRPTTQTPTLTYSDADAILTPSGTGITTGTLSIGYDIFNSGEQVISSNPTSNDTGRQGIFGVTIEVLGGAEQSFDLANATYDSVSFSVLSQDGNISDVQFNNDGTKMFVTGIGGDNVYEYALSTPYDITSATFTTSFFVRNEVGNSQGITFNTDGTELFVVGSSDSVNQYSLSTAFDISTASSTFNLSVSSEDTQPLGVEFNSNGTKMFVVGGQNDSLYQYSLSTAFDLSTASYDSVSFSVNSEDTAPSGCRFNSNGTKAYVLGAGTDTIYQYSLTTPFDISTMFYDSVSFSVASEDIAPSGIAFNDDYTKMYIGGRSGDRIYQYSDGS